MVMSALVDTKTAAERLGYSVSYVRNNWPTLFAGVRPVKLGPGRKLLWKWDEINGLLNQEK